MRILPFAISAIITGGLVFALNKQWGTIPPMGKFLSPQHGFWQNAEPADEGFDETLNFPGLKGKAEVYFDDRLVPHVFAENDEDLYFIQGYLHAKFRLFQMDLQTKAAEGRASEIAGPIAIEFDREQRRLGMKFAAENALKEMESDPQSKAMYDAYTNGVNAWINSLKESALPVEYKLLNFKPEKWTNLRTALLLKMMAKNLSSGTEHDLDYTIAKSIFFPDELKMLYPQVPDSLVPIVPKGTVFEKPGIVPVAPASADSLYFGNKDLASVEEYSRPDKNNGSNNWVVAGSKTQSGAPILCNDPHLELSLPSIWYEMQLKTPSSNTYGVSLPGSPFIIIGFNDSIAWGVTNSQRDVKDYYKIRFKDDTKAEYWFDSAWKKTTIRIESIMVKGGKMIQDTVAYTEFGPVMYDNSFGDDRSKHQNLAVRWAAHDASNEGFTFYKLNRAKNYDEYTEAIKTFSCPGQNFVFASKTGDIAIWQQGKFPARWEGQGLYIMPGEDSSYMWQGFIPQAENPHSLNPERGYLESGNQRPTDATYPYFIPGTYITPRAITIDHYLSSMNGIQPEDMMKLQNNYFNTLAEDALPILLGNIDETNLSDKQLQFLQIVKDWDLMATPDSKGQTIYQCWWDSLESAIWRDDMSIHSPPALMPEEQTTMELLKKDSLLRFIDDISTPEIETLPIVVTNAFKKAAVMLTQKESEGKLEWAKFKDPTVYHLLKNALLPFARAGLNVGGNGNIINAVTHSHGPSWRMIVHMTTPTEAYGVYPGGQSGNPGSVFYDNFIDSWVAGKYNKLWFMRDGDKTDKAVKWKMTFSQ
ncbi:MAG TPA: penicillin acylase family protein [Chitinophagaceae bacterium]|nr:penicillin acylase family protein [Chitinophagaceae bacterium]